MQYSFSRVMSSFLEPAQIKRITNFRVALGGAGGLGSNCALMLARSGFEKFVIADFDRVEVSNLNRQIYFPEHIGRAKVECLKEILLKLNPDAEIETHKIRVEKENALALFSQCDIVVEAFDCPQTKVVMAELFINSDTPLITASGLGGFGKSDRIVTRKAGRNIYLIGDEVSAISKKVKPFAPCVTIAAAKQADVVLSLALGFEPV